MSAATAIPPGVLFRQDFTGARVLTPQATSEALLPPSSAWDQAYQELIRPLYFDVSATFGGLVYCYTSSSSLELVMEALPIPRHEGPSEALASLRTIERAFGDSASDLAKMLRVSRPMIYHYRQGMEPSVDNLRRIRLIAGLTDYVSTEADISLESVLKSHQPEGKSLLDLISEQSPDVALIRRILLRTAVDLQKRQRVAAALGYATPNDRQDIMRARHASGKPIYVTDLDSPSKIVQIRPDQSRVRGRMVNRVFVPDEE